MKESKFIKLKEPVDGYNTLEVQVFYTLWGHSYFTWSNERRWIYISMKPAEEILDASWNRIGHKFTLMWKWFKLLLKEMKRANKKTLSDISDTVFSSFDDEELLRIFEERDGGPLFELKENL